MVIYGYKGTQVGQTVLPDPCPNCGAAFSLETYVFQMYAHISWVPVFPAFKTGVIQCNKCQQQYKYKQMPPDLKASYKNFKSTTKMPLWTFSGLAIILVIAFFVVRYNNQQKEDTVAFLKTPKIGDIIDVKVSPKAYTLYKIGLVEKDSVFIFPHLYETDRKSGLSMLKEKGDSAFSQDLYGYSKTELQQMLNKGEILNIER